MTQAQQSQQQQQQQQQQLPPFDLQAYISRYDPRSETHLQRLLFLAHHFHDQHQRGNINGNLGTESGGGNNGTDESNISSDTNNNNDNNSIARQAFELAVRRMKESGNHRRYLEEYGAVADTPGAAVGGHVEGIGGHVGGGNNNSNDAPELTDTPIRRPRSESHTTTPTTHYKKHHIISQYLDYDPTFPSNSKHASQNRLETMEGRLSTAQSKLMKESIRSALLALAEFHKERGELREAWRRVARSREYCANGRQHIQVCLLLVELGVDLREWPSVRDTISRAEHTVMVTSSDNNNNPNNNTNHNNNNDPHNNSGGDPLFHQKLRAAQALGHLAEARYAEAAKSFTSISPELTNQFSSVISAEDLATYGSVLGLATMDRNTLHSLVIDGVFKGRLELVPAMREALRHYSRAEYGQCLSLLQKSIRRDLLLDIHLHAHVPVLLDMIRDRCIVQYFQPYSSVSLRKMGNVFGYHGNDNVDAMEEVVAKLISNGGVDGMTLGEGARINALDKTLSVEGPKSAERRARRKARAMAAKMGVEFARNAEGMILRAACIENGITIQSDKRSGGWRNRSGRSNRGGGGDVGGRHNVPSDRGGMLGPDPYESDESVSDDAMDIDNHIVNPNEF